MNKHADCDNGPTKSVIMNDKESRYYELCFAKRPAAGGCGKKEPPPEEKTAKESAPEAAVQTRPDPAPEAAAGAEEATGEPEEEKPVTRVVNLKGPAGTGQKMTKLVEAKKMIPGGALETLGVSGPTPEEMNDPNLAGKCDRAKRTLIMNRKANQRFYKGAVRPSEYIPPDAPVEQMEKPRKGKRAVKR